MRKNLLLNFRWLSMFLILTLSSMISNAQNIEISGVISDSLTGTTLVGANVLQKGTSNGTVTDVTGKYNLNVLKGSTIVISFIGYKTQEITVKESRTLNIKLQSTSVDLGEFLIIGYGTQKKTDKTGAVAMVKAEELNGGVLTDPIQAMQGKAAGVSVTKKGGDPNEGFSVRVRGASGFSSNTQPLFVINGVPGADPTIISPNDIESYNVLKDAASTDRKSVV